METKSEGRMLYRHDEIRGAMAKQGFTVDSLAEKTGLNPNTVSAVRNGKSVNVESLIKVARALGLTLSDLGDGLEEDKDPASPASEVA
jgi:transcriptional regulator with XRE-family HTH domain